MNAGVNFCGSFLVEESRCRRAHRSDALVEKLRASMAERRGTRVGMNALTAFFVVDFS
jgi:hypothetical protein